MGKGNAGRRQKKLAKKKAARKAKAKTLARQRQTAVEGSSPAQRLLRVARWPVFECRINDAWRNPEMPGLATVMVARRASHGAIAVASYLVDLACLGVKDAGLHLDLDDIDYRELVERAGQHGQTPLDPCEPSLAARVVLEGEAYAHELGFAPHRDYEALRIFLADIDPEECKEEIVCGGPEGKPLYIAGPRDNAEAIRAALERRLGPDGFHFLMPM